MAAFVAMAKHLQHVQVPGPGGKHSSQWRTSGRDGTHLDSASASHRGAAASLLDQSELDLAAAVAKAKHLQVQVEVPGPDGKHTLLDWQRQRRARTLSLPPPRTVGRAAASLLDQSKLF